MMHLKLKIPVMWLTLAALAANAQPDRSHVKALSEGQLKAAYLECDELASTTILDFPAAAHCSMVGEELLGRGFGGNFDELLKWWRRTRDDCAQKEGCAKQSY
jgi:hypothetical protein